MRITPLGEIVLTHGRDLLAKAEAAADAIDRFKAGEGRVDIGTFQSVSNVILPSIVRRLRDEHPAVDIRLFEEETDQPRADELDILFFDGRVDGEVEHLKLLDDPYVLVARRGDFPDGPVALDRLHGLPMVAHPPICDQRRVEKLFAQNGVRPVVVFRTADNRAVASMVRAGMGSAVMPLLALDIRPDDDTLRTHPLHPPIPPREIYMLWQAGRTLSPLAHRVIAMATNVANEIINHRPTIS